MAHPVPAPPPCPPCLPPVPVPSPSPSPSCPPSPTPHPTLTFAPSISSQQPPPTQPPFPILGDMSSAAAAAAVAERGRLTRRRRDNARCFSVCVVAMAGTVALANLCSLVSLSAGKCPTVDLGSSPAWTCVAQGYHPTAHCQVKFEQKTRDECGGASMQCLAVRCSATLFFVCPNKGMVGCALRRPRFPRPPSRVPNPLPIGFPPHTPLPHRLFKGSAPRGFPFYSLHLDRKKKESCYYPATYSSPGH